MNFIFSNFKNMIFLSVYVYYIYFILILKNRKNIPIPGENLGLGYIHAYTNPSIKMHI